MLETDANQVLSYLKDLQTSICEKLEVYEIQQGGEVFLTDSWSRAEGGGGTARVLANGQIFEKAGVNFSHVSGEQLPPSATASRPELAGKPFDAMGVSVVLHPRNPYVPTTHANVRFFRTVSDDNPVWWFGGGFDLTPYYAFKEDCIHWHRVAKAACDPFGDSLYEQMKLACDKYFYLPHRQEARGIGGLFFDDFKEDGFDHSFALMRSVGDHFLSAYLPILDRRRDIRYGEREVSFQHYRRGRYVEFNLVHDRGTLFGLQSGGRTESILMSLPPVVNWSYNWQPEEGTPEAELYDHFLPARDWLGSD